eukprot:Selendium_serpulae@DN10953_c0_g1_i1.p1
MGLGRLLVGTVSYRDPELPSTLISLITHARQPGAIRVGVTLQTVSQSPSANGESETDFLAVEEAFRARVPSTASVTTEADMGRAAKALGTMVTIVEADAWQHVSGTVSLELICGG